MEKKWKYNPDFFYAEQGILTIV